MFTHGLTSVINGDIMLSEETDFDNFQDDDEMSCVGKNKFFDHLLLPGSFAPSKN